MFCTSNILDVCVVPALTNTLLFACPEPSPKTRLCKFNWLLHQTVNGVALCPIPTLLLAAGHEPLDIIYEPISTLLLELVVRFAPEKYHAVILKLHVVTPCNDDLVRTVL